MRRILFVDDDPRLLDGLKRMLYPFRSEWEMVFASGGQEALQFLAASEFDVLITDLSMPQMTGIELLTKVIERHPRVVRLVLSGTADEEATLPSLLLAHQYLAKPCEAATLRSTVERAVQLQVVIGDPELKHLVSRIRSLPSIPAIYMQLIDALRSPDVSAQDVGRIISRDLAMTTKILQLVNSAFFGARRQINNPSEAAVYLGTSTIRTLVLSTSVFSQFKASRIPGFSIEGLRDHGMSVALLARDIAKSLKLPPSGVETAFLGGLLHEIGKLVLATTYPTQYERALRVMQQEALSAREAEYQVFGTSHAEVGAYLLWLWGLPRAIGEIVAYHHHPSPDHTSGAVVAVHAAAALIGEVPDRDIDHDCLAAMGLTTHLSAWKGMRDDIPSGVAC